ncbi:Apoptogenic protein 1, mitochondrial, partial [Lobosporangium transversale]
MSLLQKSTARSLGISRQHAYISVNKLALSTVYMSTLTASRKRESLDPALHTDKYLVGTPHPVSNLRPIKYPVPENESQEDRAFRERCERVDAFNQNFWVNNNAMFNKAKANYEEKS